MAEDHPPPPESVILLDLIKQCYGARLTPAELDEVRKGVAGLVQAAQALRSVALANNDEPFSIFVPYCKEGAEHGT
jgi:hypothetical protein